MPTPTQGLDPAKRYVVALSTNCGSIAIQAGRETGAEDDSVLRLPGATRLLQRPHLPPGGGELRDPGGDPNGDGSGGPGYTIVERPPANLRYTRGTVAMAKTGTDPAGASGSQFFIVTEQEAELPPQYALVGRVVGTMAGVNAIAKLATIPPQDGEPIHPVVISRASLSES